MRAIIAISSSIRIQDKEVYVTLPRVERPRRALAAGKVVKDDLG